MLRDLYLLIKSLTRPERMAFFVFGVIFLISCVLFSINSFYKNTIPKPSQGGEYTEGVVGQPVKINPIIAGNNDVDKDLIEVIFSDLISLSESYATSNSNKTWLVTLKPELRWSDGQSLTSDDVIFTIETIQNPEALSPMFSSWQGVVAERLSGREIRFTLKTPYVYFLDNLKSLKIVPAHAFESVPVSNLHLSEYNLEPIGSGPYKFAGYDKEKSGFINTYRLTTNEYFSGAKTLITNLQFKFFKTYEDAIADFNLRGIDGLGGFDPLLAPEIKLTHTIKQIQIPRYYAIFFNSNINPLLKDLNIRKALNLAIDKERIIKTVFNDEATRAFGPILPFVSGFDPSIYTETTSSQENSAEILEKAGWKIGEGGIRTKGSGKNLQKLELEIVTPDLKFLATTAELIKEDWAKIGIKLSIISLPPSEVSGEVIRSRNYQMLLFGNVLRGNPDVFSFWHSSQRFSPGLNLSIYENRTLDNLLESARKEFNEIARNQAIAKIQKIINDDRAAIFLYSPTYLYASPRALGGFENKLILSPTGRFTNINKWFMETTRVFK